MLLEVTIFFTYEFGLDSYDNHIKRKKLLIPVILFKSLAFTLANYSDHFFVWLSLISFARMLISFSCSLDLKNTEINCWSSIQHNIWMHFFLIKLIIQFCQISRTTLQSLQSHPSNNRSTPDKWVPLVGNQWAKSLTMGQIKN